MRTKLLSLAIMMLCLIGSQSVMLAQTVYVNSSTGNDGTGDGSSGNPYKTFNKGYNMVSVGGTIDLTGTFTWTDASETGDAPTSGFTIAKNITILGHVSQTIIQAASSAGTANCRVFTVDAANSVTFNNLEIRYGNPPNPGDGGGMYFASSATITISNCYIHHNTSRQGVGICIMTATVGITNSTIANNNGTSNQSGVNGGGIGIQGTMPLTITNTTICNNYINGYGGGINTLATNTTTLTNCTIVNNTSEQDGGGISIGGNAGCTLQIKNTIIANNTSNTVSASADFDHYAGTLTDNGYNIVEYHNSTTMTGTGDKTGNQVNLFGTGIGATPSLALNSSINGTPTLALSTGSVAINAGSTVANGSVAIPTTDQRGLNRVGATEIGAYEFGSTPPAPTVTGISPTSGTTTGGTSVVITGTNLTGATSVLFGSTAGTGVTVNSATSITVTSPVGTAGTIHITVTTPGGTSATSTSDQFTYAAPGTFTQSTSTDWATASNWIGGVPTSATNVTIPSGKNPVISATTTATCNNLTVSGTLTIQSSASGTGSLIISGASTGTVNCERYMTGSKWHWVSPLAVGGSVNTFIQAPGNAVALSGSNYGMMDYNETSNVWNPYFTTATIGNFPAGKGYGIRRSTDGVATFTGTLTTGTNTVAITKGGTAGWNLIGNPYTSSIYMNTAANASYNFIATNSSKLDASYACIYLWDVATSTYKILGNTSYSGRDLDINVFAPGQAFFVKAASAGTVEFNKNMQVQQTGATFKAPAVTTSWPGIALKAASADASSSAIITFNEKMTKGLDPTYDAGLLRGTNGLSLYTRLVEDNGVDFAIQCLPENYSNLVIPVGVDYKDGGEITFSAETVELPKNCKVMIEDKTTNTFTSLAEGGTYKTTVSAGSTSAGRFYIHTSGNTTTGTSELTADINSLKAYIANEAIIIEGEVGDQAIATLYNLQGVKVRVNLLKKGYLNTLPCSYLTKGIYLLTIQQNGKTETKKLIKE